MAGGRGVSGLGGVGLGGGLGVGGLGDLDGIGSGTGGDVVSSSSTMFVAKERISSSSLSSSET